MTPAPPLTDQERADFMAMFLQAQTLEEKYDLDRRRCRAALRLWDGHLTTGSLF